MYYLHPRVDHKCPMSSTHIVLNILSMCMVNFTIPTKAFLNVNHGFEAMCNIHIKCALYHHLASYALQHVVALLIINFILYGILRLIEILKKWCRLDVGYDMAII
jgi:hypothetical protein